MAEGEERIVQTEAFKVSSRAFSDAWGKSPAGHCRFPEGPFCKTHFRIKEVLLGISKYVKHIAEGRQRASSDKLQELNGKCIEKQSFSQGRHKYQKIGISIYFLRQQIGVQKMAESQAVAHCQAMISVMLSNFI